MHQGWSLIRTLRCLSMLISEYQEANGKLEHVSVQDLLWLSISADVSSLTKLNETVLTIEK